jgi:hypothetical protein
VFLVLKPPWAQQIIFWHGVASAASLLHFILLVRFTLHQIFLHQIKNGVPMGTPCNETDTGHIWDIPGEYIYR